MSGRRQWPLRLALWGVLALGLAPEGLAQSDAGVVAQEERLERLRADGQSNLRYRAPGPPAPRPADPLDERPLWRLLQAGKLGELRAWIERLRRWRADWTPPAALLEALEQGERRQAIAAARARADWPRLIALAERHPAAFGCGRIDNLRALARARRAVEGAQAAARLYRRILSDCRDPAGALATLEQAREVLPRHLTAALVEDLAPEDAPAGLDDFLIAFHAAWLAEAVEAGDYAAGRIPAAALAGVLARRPDAERARLIGAYLAGQGRFAEARVWFARALSWRPEAESAYALAWAALEAGDIAAAQALAARWRGRDPRFAGLRARIAVSRAQRAFAAGDYAAALSQAQAARRSAASLDGGAEAALSEIVAWSLFHLGRYPAALRRFAALYRGRATPERAEALVQAALAAADYDTPLAILAADPAGPLARLLSGDSPSDLGYRFHAARIGTALAGQDRDGALAAAAPLAEAIRARRDLSLALPLAWARLERGRPGEAAEWFADALDWGAGASAAEGLAEALRRLGRVEELEVLARRWAGRSPALARVYGELALAGAERAYAAGDPAGAIRLAEAAEAQAGASRRSRLLIAWSLYRQGEPAAALPRFEALYRAQPDREAAEGLLQAARAAGEEARAARAAEALGGPLEWLWRDAQAERYLALGLPFLAASARVSEDPRLRGLGRPAVATQPFVHRRSGAPGEDRLTVVGLANSARAARGPHRLGLRLDLLWLDAGPSGTAALDTRAFAVEPAVDYAFVRPRLEGADIFGARLATTPIGGALPPRPVGALSWERRMPGQSWTLALFSESRRDSLLSTLGLEDPGAGRTWGRVTESGLDAGLRQAIGGPWSLGGAARLSWLDGRGVADNQRVRLAGALGYAVPLADLDYLTVGPRYRFERYAENLGRFTFGHGGYFSPQSLHRLALGVDLQGGAGGELLLRGAGSLGWQTTRTAASREFPLSGSGAVIAGDRQSGLAADATLSAAYRLGDRLILGGDLLGLYSEDFNALSVGLFVRWSFGGRGAVFPSDLPPAPWR